MRVSEEGHIMAEHAPRYATEVSYTGEARQARPLQTPPSPDRGGTNGCEAPMRASRRRQGRRSPTTRIGPFGWLSTEWTSTWSREP